MSPPLRDFGRRLDLARKESQSYTLPSLIAPSASGARGARVPDGDGARHKMTRLRGIVHTVRRVTLDLDSKYGNTDGSGIIAPKSISHKKVLGRAKQSPPLLV